MDEGRYAESRTVSLDEIDAFKAELRGDVLTPSEPGYADARRVFNGLVERHPSLIARCLGTSDVRLAVKFARRNGLLTSIKGGGHHHAGTAVCDDGLMIDNSLMRGVQVDPATRRVFVQPGARNGDIDTETQLFGLAVPAGTVSPTGVAGLALGGGVGHLMRSRGLTCDALRRAQVVTAEGDLIEASDTDNPDLFWALRGGGGNFGVVTQFEFEAYSVGPTVYGGPLIWPIGEADDVLPFLMEFARRAPRELGLSITLAKVLPGLLPPGVTKDLVLIATPCYSGPDLETGEALVGELRRVKRPIVDVAGAQSYTAIQASLDPALPMGRPSYIKSGFIDSLTDEVFAVMRHAVATAPAGIADFYINLALLGGAVADRGSIDDSAFPRRDAEYVYEVVPYWTSPHADGNAIIEWARRTADELNEFSGLGGHYTNFLSDREPELVKLAWGPERLDRLAEIKQKYDPTNFFRVNHNVIPAPASVGAG